MLKQYLECYNAPKFFVRLKIFEILLQENRFGKFPISNCAFYCQFKNNFAAKIQIADAIRRFANFHLGIDKF